MVVGHPLRGPHSTGACVVRKHVKDPGLLCVDHCEGLTALSHGVRVVSPLEGAGPVGGVVPVFERLLDEYYRLCKVFSC